jgi:hypothetical protein
MFVLPTNWTPRARAIARHAASFSAGALVLARYSEPAEVTTPFMSIESFTAKRSFWLLGLDGQYSINARSRVALAAGPILGMGAQLLRHIETAKLANNTRPEKEKPSLTMIAPTKQHSAIRANKKGIAAIPFYL